VTASSFTFPFFVVVVVAAFVGFVFECPFFVAVARVVVFGAAVLRTVFLTAAIGVILSSFRRWLCCVFPRSWFTYSCSVLAFAIPVFGLSCG